MSCFSDKYQGLPQHTKKTFFDGLQSGTAEGCSPYYLEIGHLNPNDSTTIHGWKFNRTKMACGLREEGVTNSTLSYFRQSWTSISSCIQRWVNSNFLKVFYATSAIAWSPAFFKTSPSLCFRSHVIGNTCPVSGYWPSLNQREIFPTKKKRNKQATLDIPNNHVSCTHGSNGIHHLGMYLQNYVSKMTPDNE